MDALLVLISLSFYRAYAASPDPPQRIVKRQRDSSSSSSTPTSSPTTHPPGPSLPTTLQTRIPIPPTPPPDAGPQTALPEHPGSNSDKGVIIGFSIGIVVIALLFAALGWMLFRRYKKTKQQQSALQNAVRLQATNHSPSCTTKRSFDDTQSGASHK